MPIANDKNKGVATALKTGGGQGFPPVLVIAGPTGSGKTGLAVKLAQALNGEVISADSRAIYKGMDIGTAKPDLAEREGVTHFGFDLVEPGERWTVADFVAYANKKIVQIRKRGHLPIVAGGTGLYIDALVYEYGFNDVVKKTYSDRAKMSADFVIIGLKWDRAVLKKRLRERANKLFMQRADGGIERETKELAERYGWQNQAMTSNIYPICWRMMQGEIDRQTAEELTAIEDWHLAKRQLTWFKRNPKIHWLSPEAAYDWAINFYRVADKMKLQE